ncbi:MAG: hypothetical protein ACWGMZ_04530 [Thermoguttaceae bacterium]
MIREILANRSSPAHDIVIANAAAALWTMGRDPSLKKCAQHATAAIADGKPRQLVDRLVKQTQTH